jgi:hypothetical protein
LQAHVHDFAILIDGSPEVVLLTTDLYEDLVQKVSVAKAGMSAPKTFGKLMSEFVDPEPNGFVANGNIALGE